jgi:hypothetical protein
MVAAQTVTYSSYDTMQPDDRRRLQSSVYNAMSGFGATTNIAFWQNLTPEFQSSITKEIEEYKQEQARKIIAAKENRRALNNREWDAGKAGGAIWITQQPTERYSQKPIGKQGYKWISNFQGKNGNWYARYRPVRGGANLRYYTISTEEWDVHSPVRLVCENNHNFASMTPVANTVCPECQSTNIKTGATW